VANETAELLAENLKRGQIADTGDGWNEVVGVSTYGDRTVVEYLPSGRKRPKKLTLPPGSRIRTIDEHVEVEPDESGYHEAVRAEEERLAREAEASKQQQE
jgi:hypothetical protein